MITKERITSAIKEYLNDILVEESSRVDITEPSPNVLLISVKDLRANSPIHFFEVRVKTTY